ncbi:MAG TPA: RNB domain-containing ribonuclease [Verrucomicrobiae bacterium]|nr:RNB domain-containing ribonuclease [Verrucomicrobiae bacterium]
MKSTGITPTDMRSQPKPVPQGISNDRTTLAAIARQAMIERGLEPDFPLAAQKELAAIVGPAKATENILDLRDRLWASIDNDDSRDLDQLTVAESLADGQVRILVAVADVDALVRKGSALDGHAAHNTTSVYTPAAIFPMLPEELSANLTSLNEDQDRIAIVADMVFKEDGSAVSSELYRGQVRNRAKLAYSSVAAWLTGTGTAPKRIGEVPGLDENLRLQDRVAQRLTDLRHLHGALSLETLEAQAVFAGDALSTLVLDQTNRANQLIEEFMIAANAIVAIYLAKKNFPSLRRVLHDPERWARIIELAAELKEQLPAAPDAVALEGFLTRRRNAAPEKFADLSLSVIKLIGRGEYGLDRPGDVPPGHFALAVKDYTHSTAPNRRYPDLITQRLLKAALSGAPLPYTISELTELAKHCTDQEDAATKVERRVIKSAAALLLTGSIGQQFDAIVTGAAAKGTWVRLVWPPTEGRLTLGFQGLKVGDHVRVKLIHTDVQRGFIDFART